MTTTSDTSVTAALHAAQVIATEPGEYLVIVAMCHGTTVVAQRLTLVESAAYLAAELTRGASTAVLVVCGVSAHAVFAADRVSRQLAVAQIAVTATVRVEFGMCATAADPAAAPIATLVPASIGRWLAAAATPRRIHHSALEKAG